MSCYLGRDMIDEEQVHKNLTTEALTKILIRSCVESDWDEDMYGDMYICGDHNVHQTSDQQEFTAYEDALKHEIWWLGQEVKPNG